MNDFFLDSDYDLQIEDGDLLVQDTDDQNIELIFVSNLGQWYNNPLIGIGIEKKIKSNVNKVSIKKDIKTQLESDNYRVDVLNVGGGIDELTINLDATKTK